MRKRKIHPHVHKLRLNLPSTCIYCVLNVLTTRLFKNQIKLKDV